MNFSPDNRATLEALLQGLQAGVPGEQAAPILSATLAAQAAQQDARTAKYQEMASNVANMAGQGMTYGAVGNYVDAMTPREGIPGRFQGLMDSAYANADLPPGLLPEPGQPGFADTSRQSPEIQAQLQSPLYTQNPASVGAWAPNMQTGQSQLMSAPQQAQYGALQQALASQPAPPKPTSADAMGQVNAQINKMKAAQMSPEQIVQAINTDAGVQGVIMDNFAEFSTMQPDIVSLMAPGAGF